VVDHAFGVSCLKKRSDPVSDGEPLALVHARDEAGAEAAAGELASAYEIGDEAPARRSVVLDVLA
jgi:thymidine phosphorylase